MAMQYTIAFNTTFDHPLKLNIYYVRVGLYLIIQLVLPCLHNGHRMITKNSQACKLQHTITIAVTLIIF